MLWAGAQGGLEVRREKDGSARLSGRFPYGVPAVLSDGGRTGRPQKEIIEPRAFSYRVELPTEDIHLLVGHDFDHPLASKLTGSLNLRDTAAALTFEARVPPAIAETSHGRDALALIATGLSVGISPGFRIPPKRAVAEAEVIEEEPDRPEEGMHRAVIRRVRAALLYELSVVTRPAYPEAQIEARRWDLSPKSTLRPLGRPLARWRA
jgi:HK97 family phage prohead protease